MNFLRPAEVMENSNFVNSLAAVEITFRLSSIRNVIFLKLFDSGSGLKTSDRAQGQGAGR
jgi:hypothetical protein